MAYNPYDHYKQQTVMTMTHGEMLAKLFDAVIRHLNSASRAIDTKDYVASNASLLKAQDIIRYLDTTLDNKYDISKSLSSLYDFFLRQIISANVKKDSAMLQEIVPLVAELKSTFEQAEKLARIGTQPTGTPSVGITTMG